MKKIVIAAAAVMLTGGAVFASGAPTNGSDKVTYFSQQTFYEEFGDLPDVTWDATAEFDKATFEKDGISYTAYFSKHGDFIGTAHSIAFGQLPANAVKYIDKRYGADAVTEVFEYNDNEESDVPMMITGIPVDSDNYFVEVKDKHNKAEVLQVSPEGEVSFFTEIR